MTFGCLLPLETTIVVAALQIVIHIIWAANILWNQTQSKHHRYRIYHLFIQRWQDLEDRGANWDWEKKIEQIHKLPSSLSFHYSHMSLVCYPQFISSWNYPGWHPPFSEHEFYVTCHEWRRYARIILSTISVTAKTYRIFALEFDYKNVQNYFLKPFTGHLGPWLYDSVVQDISD